jgi:hypothetical protein
MDKHLRIHRWVIWWFYVGVIGGLIALVNIFGHSLTGFQERLLLIVGAAFWLLGGVVCWAFESVKFEAPPLPPTIQKSPNAGPEREWHPASDFLLPGRGKSILPWRH